MSFFEKILPVAYLERFEAFNRAKNTSQFYEYKGIRYQIDKKQKIYGLLYTFSSWFCCVIAVILANTLFKDSMFLSLLFGAFLCALLCATLMAIIMRKFVEEADKNIVKRKNDK